MAHAYDFYKPDLTNEYPYIDGHFSIKCAILKPSTTVIGVYNACEAKLTSGAAATSTVSVNCFVYVLFHACKLGQKSYARIMYSDYLTNQESEGYAPFPAEIKEIPFETSLSGKIIEKAFMTLSKSLFEFHIKPDSQNPTMCCNMYSVTYLCSHLSYVKPEDLLLPSSLLTARRVFELQMCMLREHAHLKNFQPPGETNTITKETYYREQ
ncbi:hydroxymethylglutaryl-coenzyme A synthase C-terminal [Terfezia boudieri ATCC MYA-4762]|uniref:Hydroxymethylglutaryl-coenzyme A synthase C-terminal n=1 Tax=Terfezia boudieri ATCC MYA-4762 TaxID=1051890 RepID=A0A3N4M0N2_9PEZI|nr:hydroxymethylglutaryl-coenzyme A synthase C-terminal [Terfezia boudieri ATCC MYA-4762]